MRNREFFVLYAEQQVNKLKPNSKTVLNFKHVNRLFKIMKNADVPHLEVGVKNLALGGGRGGGEEPLKSRWAMCSKCLETITLFRSTICDFF